MGFKGIAHQLSDPIAEKVERTPPGDRGVQLAEGSGGGVPGVGKERLSFFLPLAVQFFERLAGEVNFAADL
jgi:hypothetical protein